MLLVSCYLQLYEKLLTSFTTEKVFHQLPALLLHHPTNAFTPRMKRFGCIGLEATFGIRSAKDHSRNLCPTDGAGTHHTGLHRDIKRALVEILSPYRLCCGGDGLHLSMGGHIGEGLCEVMSPTDYPAGSYHHSTNRHLVFSKGFTGLIERLAHISLVVCHP